MTGNVLEGGSPGSLARGNPVESWAGGAETYRKVVESAARKLGVSLNRLNEIVLGKRGITADTALRLARFLKTSPQLWIRLQGDWDLHQAMQREARRAS